MSRLASLCLLILCSSLPTQAQVAPDPDSLIVAIAEYYKDLTTYAFEGDVSIRMRRGRQTQTTQYPIRIARRVPNHHRIEIGGEQGRALVVNDTMTWAYHLGSNQFIQLPDALPLTTLQTDFPNPVRSYARLDQVTDAARLLEADTSYALSDENRPAYLLEITPRPTEQTAGQSVTMMLWVDKEHLTVLQERTSSYIPNSPYGPISIRQTTSYASVLKGGEIPESLFVFTPPDSSAQTTHLPELPNLPYSLYGETATAFELPELATEEDVPLTSYMGKVVVLNFWATWCGPCRAEMGALQRISNDWEDDGLVVLAINEEEPPEQVQAYIDEEGLTFTVLLDRFGLVSQDYKVAQLPTTFIIDRQGIIRAHWIGARTEAGFRKGIEKWLRQGY